jgi:hypothetical protein
MKGPGVDPLQFFHSAARSNRLCDHFIHRLSRHQGRSQTQDDEYQAKALHENLLSETSSETIATRPD